MKKKLALIFGITGQDGSYLAKFLISKKYTVIGVKRRSSSVTTHRLTDIYKDPQYAKNFKMFYGDLGDYASIFKILKKFKPDEVYNLAAQSHVAVSFNIPDYTNDINANGVIRILETIKTLKLKSKFYQAGSSEMFGDVIQTPQNEKTPFNPVSPYAVSKVQAYWITAFYRKAYNIFACNGILFNHESPLRGENFVTKKIVQGLVKIKQKKQRKLFLGNIYAKRDWGHAEDYVKAQWLILQQKKPDDFVIATGKQYTVKDFINLVAKQLKLKLIWRGVGINEKAYFNDKAIIECDKRYFRPSEVETLKGDCSKARKILKWKPLHNINSLIKDMISYEINNLKE